VVDASCVEAFGESRSLYVAETEAVLSVRKRKVFSETAFSGGEMPSSVWRGGSFQPGIGASDSVFLDEQTHGKDGIGFGAFDQTGVLRKSFQDRQIG